MLTESEIKILQALKEAGIPLYPNQIAEKMKLAPQTAKQYMHGLLLGGYVERFKRGQYLITAKGLKALEDGERRNR